MDRKKDKIYIIAEIGGNFTSLEQAVRLIEAAKETGVDAVKLQTYKADTLSSRKAMFNMENTGVVSQYELFQEYSIGEELHKEVFAYARKKGLDVFSSPSHPTDVDFLESIGCDAYKVGSDDAVNLPLLRHIAGKGKPVILATGMCTMQEVRESVDCILAEGNRDITLLHAVTSYPTHAEDVNLRAMMAMMAEFPGLPVGYSDHTLGTNACICAAAMGAQVLEKHFTYDKHAEGPDHLHSADPVEMKYIVDCVRELEIMLGSGIKMPAAGEASTRKNNRKSLVLLRDIGAGERIGREDLDIKRPGYGIGPKYLEQAAGRRAAKDLQAEDVLRWEDLA